MTEDENGEKVVRPVLMMRYSDGIRDDNRSA